MAFRHRKHRHLHTPIYAFFTLTSSCRSHNDTVVHWSFASASRARFRSEIRAEITLTKIGRNIRRLTKAAAVLRPLARTRAGEHDRSKFKAISRASEGRSKPSASSNDRDNFIEIIA